MRDEIKMLMMSKKTFESLKGCLRRIHGHFKSEEDLVVVGIFHLLEKLLDGDFDSDEERIAIENLLLRLYRFSFQEFSVSAKFNFFVGYMIAIAPWFFRIKTKSTYEEMLRSAMKADPNSSLFAWGYYFTIGDRQAIRLSKNVLSDEYQMTYLQEMGKVGSYFGDAVAFTERTLAAN